LSRPAGLNYLFSGLVAGALRGAGLSVFPNVFTWRGHFLLGPCSAWPGGRLAGFDPALPVRAGALRPGVTFCDRRSTRLYACQDTAFDRERDLRSIPGPVAEDRSGLAFSSLAHANAVIFFALGGWAAGLSWIYFAFFAVGAVLLLVEHLILSENDLSRVNVSFFTINGVVAAGLGLGVIGRVLAGLKGSVWTRRGRSFIEGAIMTALAAVRHKRRLS
jgi:4-hydroxybenzoate polyprenyltransferase